MACSRNVNNICYSFYFFFCVVSRTINSTLKTVAFDLYHFTLNMSKLVQKTTKYTFVTIMYSTLSKFALLLEDLIIEALSVTGF